MFSRLMTYTLLAVVFLGLVAVSSPSQAAFIGADLQARMLQVDAEETIPVIVRMRRLSRLPLSPYLSKHERRRMVVAALVQESDLQKKDIRKLLKLLRRNYTDLWIINGLALELTPAEIRTFRTLPRVKSIAYDQPLKLAETLPQPAAVTPWNLAQINADKVPGLSGLGVVVATLDTGVDVTHPEFLPGSWRGDSGDWFNPFAPNCLANPGTCSTCDEETSQPCDGDRFGHGTGVMSLITGQDTGVAPGAQWIAAKIFRDDEFTTNSIIHQAFQWALNPDSNLGTTTDIPDVLNGSWGFETLSGVCTNPVEDFEQDIQELRNAGISVVFSAGNAGPSSDTSVSPGNYVNSFAAGFVDRDSTISPFSSRGPGACDPPGVIFPELVAPGVSVPAAFPGGLYVQTSGSSFAAPHVAGAMALVLEAFPGTSVAGMETALINSAGDLGDLGPDNTYGYGQVDVLAAYNRLSGLPNFYLHDSFAPSNDALVDFGHVTPSTPRQTATLTVENTGAGQLQITGLDSSAFKAPFTLVQEDCNGTNLGANQTCTLVVGYQSDKAGSFAGSLVIQSNDPNHPATTVSLLAEANTLPPAAQLAFPANGAQDMESTITFQWAQPVDADGDPLSYNLYVSDNASFFGVQPIAVALLIPVGGFLALAVLVGFPRARQRRLILLLIAGSLLLLQMACGGGGGGGSSAVPGGLISQQVSNLDPNTTYYWKVETLDSRGGSAESTTFNFTTR